MASFYETYANKIAPDVTPQNAASYLRLFCMLTNISSKNELKITPEALKSDSGLIKMSRMGKFIRHLWVILQENHV